MENQTSTKKQNLSYKQEYFTHGISYEIDSDNIKSLDDRLTAKSLVRDVYLSINEKLHGHGLTPLVFEENKKEVSEAKEIIFGNTCYFWMCVKYILDKSHYLYSAFEPTIIITCNEGMVDKIKSIAKNEQKFYKMLYDEDVSILIRSVNISNHSGESVTE